MASTRRRTEQRYHGESLCCFVWPLQLKTPFDSLVELSEQVGRFSAPRLRISRVAQLDAELLDRELHHILQEPVTRALHDLRVRRHLGFHLLVLIDAGQHPSRPSLEAELLAVLQFIVLRLSLHQTGASYGARLQNLKYRDERSYDGPRALVCC